MIGKIDDRRNVWNIIEWIYFNNFEEKQIIIEFIFTWIDITGWEFQKNPYQLKIFDF